MTQTVVGLFDNASDAQKAVQQLLSKGFTNDNVDISAVSASSTSGSTDLTSNTSTNTQDNETGIGKFFRNLFSDSESDADRYSKVASRSNSIVTVYAQTADEAEKAADILDDNGAVNVDEKGSEYGYGSATGAAGTAGYAATSDLGTSAGSVKDYTSGTDDANKSIKIIEENLEVGKRTVQTGGVRLKSRIVERPVEETLRLREERVNVERNTVNRPATEADFAAFKEGEIEMIERAEVPVVSKQARVVEEVSLGKEVNERNETISDTVRKTEVDVENIEGGKTTSSTDFTTGSGTSSTDYNK